MSIGTVAGVVDFHNSTNTTGREYIIIAKSQILYSQKIW